MVDYRGPQYQFPHRKPLVFQAVDNGNNVNVKLRPPSQIVPDQSPPAQAQAQAQTQQHQLLLQQQQQQQQQRQRQQRQQQHPSTLSETHAAHSRSRTASSSVFPSLSSAPDIQPDRQPPLHQPPSDGMAYQATMMMQYNQPNRRTLSNATASTSSGGGGGGGLVPARTSSTSESLRRSGSSRSTAAPMSYVALLRKQKATVWCDRSQYEDPRAVAMQKAARLRAEREIVGSAGRTSTGGSGSFTGGTRAKIRHHIKNQTAVGYGPVELVGGVGAVPMRLSASEVGEGESDDDGDSQYHPGGGGAYRTSTGGRASMGSSRAMRNPDARGPYLNTHATTTTTTTTAAPTMSTSTSGRFSGGDVTPSSNGSGGGSDGPMDPDPTPMPHHYHTYTYQQQQQQQQQQQPQHHSQQQQQQQHYQYQRQGTMTMTNDDYFAQPGGSGISGGSSGSSAERERERSFGGIGHMQMTTEHAGESGSSGRDRRAMMHHRESVEELRRRGSVDDRAVTMTGKLFVANPDPD